MSVLASRSQAEEGLVAVLKHSMIEHANLSYRYANLDLQLWSCLSVTGPCVFVCSVIIVGLQRCIAPRVWSPVAIQ